MVSVLSVCAVQKSADPTNSNNANIVFILRPVCKGKWVIGQSEEENKDGLFRGDADKIIHKKFICKW